MVACRTRLEGIRRFENRWKKKLDLNSSSSASASKRGGVLNRFAGNERGNVAIIFGLLGVSMFLLVGAAVDIGRWLNARSQTWQALDSAVLAGARSLQLNSKDQSAAETLALNVYSENVRTRLPLVSDTFQFQVTDAGTTLSATGGAYIGTLFLGLANIPKLPLFTLSGSELSKAKLAVGGNGETNVEVSLMLDITGSMKGTKLSDLKTAAKNLIDIVVWQDQSQYTSRVALVPFSEAVNVGSTFAPLVRGTPDSSYTYGSGKKSKSYDLTNCVSERTGAYAYTDDAPSTAFVGTVYTRNGSCDPAATIVPLSNDTTALKAAIDDYEAAGSTAGHMGTAWAWYMLSPNWNSVWPEANRAGAYSLLTELNKYNQPKLRKLAVLMTDGDYNVEFCKFGTGDTVGISTNDVSSCDSPNGSSKSQAEQMCTAMKASGITVYTVGFQVSNSAKTFLKNCSSGADYYYYDAQDGEALQQAFTDIALKISQLYLSK